MTLETKYDETLVASVVIEDDRQLALHHWQKATPEQTGGNWLQEQGWHVGLFDNDGNCVATIARTEATTSIAATVESNAWKMFLALIPPVTVALVRANSYFDLGSGPDRSKA